MYLVDHQGIIRDVNAGWDRFAQMNGGPPGMEVLNRRIFDFVTGDPARMYLNSLLEQSRTLQQEVIVAYRCDSPGRKRYMELRLRPLRDNSVALEHRIVREEDLQPVVTFSYHPQAIALRRCSVCNRLNRGGRWQELPDVLTPHMAHARLPVRYDVCGDCRVAGALAR